MNPKVFDALSTEQRDREVVDMLRRAGDELGRPRRVTHSFAYVATGFLTAPSIRLVNGLSGRGFEWRDNSGPPAGVRVAYFQKEHPVDLDTVQKNTKVMAELAGKTGTLYLGWQCQPVKAFEDR